VPVLNDPWKVTEGDFPRSGDVEEKLRFLLNYAVLAPSVHNTQPWLFRVRSEGWNSTPTVPAGCRS
jgi:nitroreductase